LGCYTRDAGGSVLRAVTRNASIAQGVSIMKSSTKLSIAAAALSGLLMGAAARTASASPVASGGREQAIKKSAVNAGQKALKLDDEKKDKDKGKHDCAGKNDCKGQGGCKTGDNGCKGKNSCKGKGGCSTNHKDEDKDKKVVAAAVRL
jgi:hypothetical protein